MPYKITLNITSKNFFAQRLIQAIEEQDLDYIKKLVEKDQEVMERHFEIYFVKGEYSALYTILHLLSLANYTQALEYLINEKKDLTKIDALTGKNLTPLMLAAGLGHVEAFKILLSAGADINHSNFEGGRALNFAAQNGQILIVQELIKAKAEVNQLTKDGISPLYIAAQQGHTGVVQELIKAKADVNQLTKDDGTSPLYIAAQQGHTGVVQELIKAGANVNQSNNNGASPLYIAAQQGHTGVVQELIKAGAQVNQLTKVGASPLYIAAKNGHNKVVQALTKEGAKVSQLTKNGWSPLHIAAQNGHIHIVQELIKAKAEVNKLTNDGTSPLYIAAQNGHTEVVRELIKANAEVNQLTKDGYSPLHIAAREGHTEVVQELIKAGAKVNQPNNYGHSPLHIAALNDQYEVIKCLIINGAETIKPSSFSTKKTKNLLNISKFTDELLKAKLDSALWQEINSNFNEEVTLQDFKDIVKIRVIKLTQQAGNSISLQELIQKMDELNPALVGIEDLEVKDIIIDALKLSLEWQLQSISIQGLIEGENIALYKTTIDKAYKDGWLNEACFNEFNNQSLSTHNLEGVIFNDILGLPKDTAATSELNGNIKAAFYKQLYNCFKVQAASACNITDDQSMLIKAINQLVDKETQQKMIDQYNAIFTKDGALDALKLEQAWANLVDYAALKFKWSHEISYSLKELETLQNTTPEEKVQIKQSILFHSLFPEFSDNITKLFADENYLEQFKVVCSSSQDFAKLLKEAILPCYIKAKINAMVDEVKSSQTDIAEIMDGHSVAESLDSSLDIGEMSSIEKTGLGSDYFSD